VLALTPALGASTANPVFLYGLSFDQLFLWRLLGSENGNSAEKQEAARLHQAEETRRYCRSVCRVRRGARVFRSQISEHLGPRIPRLAAEWVMEIAVKI
jgi:hypothetical protein